MNWASCDANDFFFSPFDLLRNRWALLSAGTQKYWDTMTVSWGQFGELWGKHVATVYVRPQRHTHFFMDMCDTFSISFLPEADHRIMEYCGKKSGREVDKAAETGLRPIFDHNTILFEQSELTIVCRKLYVQRIDPAGFIDRECDTKNYPNHDYHDMYIGEIIGIYRAQA